MKPPKTLSQVRKLSSESGKTNEKNYNLNQDLNYPDSKSQSNSTFQDLEKATFNEETYAKLEKLTVTAFPTLSQVVKLELFANEPTDKIHVIWKNYHQTKFCLSSVIEAQKYFELEKLIDQFPSYIVPLVKDNGGVDFFFFQKNKNAWIFTSLDEFKNKRQNAKPVLTVVYYTELVTEKNIVLMRANINPRFLTLIQSQYLVNRVQVSYLQSEEFENVKKFHQNPESFDWSSLSSGFIAGSPEHVHTPDCDHKNHTDEK